MKLTVIFVTILAVNANFPVQDTEDVRAAKAIFYKAFAAAKAGEHAALVSDVNASVPGYIEDAEDVKAAKAEFFKAFAAAEAGDNYLADTPEVAKARKAFFAFYEKRKLCLSRLANEKRSKRSYISCGFGGGGYPSNDYNDFYDPVYDYNDGAATDCYDIYKSNLPLPGVYNIKSIGPVYCLEDGSTSIQHRGQYGNPQDLFAKNWNEYVQGFGNPNDEHWIGLEAIYKMTNDQSRPMGLRIVGKTFSGVVKEIEFSSFRIEGEDDDYRLRLGNFYGATVNSFNDNSLSNIQNQNNMRFSTKDRDHDTSGGDCSNQLGSGGGWWFNNCGQVNLNGLNYDNCCPPRPDFGIYWNNFKDQFSSQESLKEVRMSIFSVGSPYK